MAELIRTKNPPPPRLQRSMFDRSHTYKTTLDAGGLVPVFIDEVIPGDTVNLNMKFFSRMATLEKPVMDNLYLDTFFFFCPNRLLWDNWKKFMGERNSPNDSIDFLVPRATHNGSGPVASNSLWSYFGFPQVDDLADDDCPSDLVFRMYTRVWNEWFRDQNIYGSLPLETGDSDVDRNEMTIYPRARRADYFSTCLPWPEKPGDDIVTPIVPDRTNSYPTFRLESNDYDLGALEGATGNILAQYANAPNDNSQAEWNDPGLLLDMDLFRQAWAMDDFLKQDARYGTRYVEIIRGHFDVISPDFRLQRTEFLGGGSTPISVNPITATAEGTATAVGDISATGTVAGSNGFSSSFTEHGIIMGLINIRCEHSYTNMMDRTWTRRTRWDYYSPEFANLGEQAVLKRELACRDQSFSTQNKEVFGYQPRWEEYRYKNSAATGLFNTREAGNLSIWHFAEEGVPTLGSFIADSSSNLVDRVINVPSEPQFLFDSYISVKSARLMPMFSVPAKLGRM